jgi:hypothetical protein
MLQYVGLLFNLAKAEQQLGRQERSQALMEQVLQQAKGVAGGQLVRVGGSGWKGDLSSRRAHCLLPACLPACLRMGASTPPYIHACMHAAAA